MNENTNGLLRDFFPKGTDFTTIHPATVAKVERLLNRRPRKSLGFHTPNEVFHALAKRGWMLCTGELNLRYVLRKRARTTPWEKHPDTL